MRNVRRAVKRFRMAHLTIHEAYNQSIKIANWGEDAARAWMEDDDIVVDEGAILVFNGLADGVEIPAKGRLTIRIGDYLAIDGRMDAAGILCVEGGEIEVATIQTHPGTGQIDLTTYDPV